MAISRKEFLHMYDEELKTDPLYVHKMFVVMGTNQIPEIRETTSLNKKYNEDIKRINLELKGEEFKR